MDTFKSTKSVNFGFSFITGPLEAFVRLHRHDEIELAIVERGTVVTMMGTQRFATPVGHLLVFWATQPHGPVSVTPDAIAHAIHLPLRWVVDWKIPGSLMKRLLQHECLIGPHPQDAMLPDIARIKNWVELMQSGSADLQEAVLLEIHARLMRLGHETLISKNSAKVLSIDNHFLSMALYLASHYREKISVNEVAAHVGLHRNYAMRLFRRTCSMTMFDYLRQHRIAHAQRLLLTTDLKIVDIAYDSGFETLSRFYDTFTRITATTPSAFRKQSMSEIVQI